MRPIIWFDSETTGLNVRFGDNSGTKLEDTHDIVNLAGLIIIKGKPVLKFDYYCQPTRYDNIDKKALEINGLTVEQLKTFPKPSTIYKKLVAILSKYVDKYNKTEKFIIGGHNCNFDLDALDNFFQKQGDKFLGSFIQRSFQLDTMRMANYFAYKRQLDLASISSFSLGSLAKHLNITETKGHTALSDVITSYKIFKHFDSFYDNGVPF